MLAEAGMLEVTLWVAAVFVIGLVVYCAAIIAWAFVDALRVARWYYRTNPEATPPDKTVVHLGLIGVRPLPRRTRNPW